MRSIRFCLLDDARNVFASSSRGIRPPSSRYTRRTNCSSVSASLRVMSAADHSLAKIVSIASAASVTFCRAAVPRSIFLTEITGLVGFLITASGRRTGGGVHCFCFCFAACNRFCMAARFCACVTSVMKRQDTVEKTMRRIALFSLLVYRK